MTEELTSTLAQLSSLFVIARSSTFTYKGQAVKVQDVGRELGVRYVLKGSVRKAANRVRVTAQLIDATTGGHLWAQTYDREMQDIFVVQDEVTQRSCSRSKSLSRQRNKRGFDRLPHTIWKPMTISCAGIVK
jgi:adenylate cyclase